MKRYFIASLFLFFLFGLREIFSQKFPLDTIFISGPIDNRINFVFLSDGYRPEELDKFHNDMQTAFDYFFNEVPYKNYKNYFNIFGIRVPSNESGASHPRTAQDCPDSASHPYLIVDNYFGSTFDVAGIHRLLGVTHTNRVGNVLESNFPNFDQVYVLVNSPYYGGSGGMIPVSSTNFAMGDVILHETTHSIAELSDEYGGDCTYKSLLGPNVTNKTTRGDIPWKMWIDDTTSLPTPQDTNYRTVAGLFEGAYYCDHGWYRPNLYCKMRSLYTQFCVVCTQTLIERFHLMVDAVDSYSPKAAILNVKDTILKFRAKTVRPEPNTLSITWKLDDKEILQMSDSLDIATTDLKAGNYRFTFTVLDTTHLARPANYSGLYLKYLEWIIRKTASDVDISSSVFNITFRVLPNPVGDQLTMAFETDKAGRMQAELADINGRIIAGLVDEYVAPGKHAVSRNISGLNIAPGAYSLLITIDGKLLVRQIIKL